jgi:hypothetical protein
LGISWFLHFMPLDWVRGLCNDLSDHPTIYSDAKCCDRESSTGPPSPAESKPPPGHA